MQLMHIASKSLIGYKVMSMVSWHTTNALGLQVSDWLQIDEYGLMTDIPNALCLQVSETAVVPVTILVNYIYRYC